tara:strand:+ start:328 stop:663 length:336 start_codon:yes stop_codon:yes gene_type:complete
LNKLKGNENIASLFEKGEKLFVQPLCLFYKKSNVTAYGVSVGKRSFSLAVDRNKIKRALRVGIRKHLFPVFEDLEVDYHFIVLYLDNKKPISDDLAVAFKALVKKFKEDVF